MTNPPIELPIETVVQILTALGLRSLDSLIGYRDDDIRIVVFHILGPKLPPDERRTLALTVLAQTGTTIPSSATPQQILAAMEAMESLDADTPEFMQAQTTAATLAIVANQMYAAQIILGSGPDFAFGWQCAREELWRAAQASEAAGDHRASSVSTDEVRYLARQLSRATVPVGQGQEFPVGDGLVLLVKPSFGAGPGENYVGRLQRADGQAVSFWHDSGPWTAMSVGVLVAIAIDAVEKIAASQEIMR